jgi:diaminopimelate epimerase
MDFAKGYEPDGDRAGVDFLLLLDLPAAQPLRLHPVRALCDRRRGLGADAVLRVTVAGSAREAGVFDVLPDDLTADDWYLDCHTADGVALCREEDGLCIFAHYLWAAGLERRLQYTVGTASGARTVELNAVDAMEADVTVTGAAGTSRGSSVLVARGRIERQWWRTALSD